MSYPILSHGELFVGGKYPPKTIQFTSQNMFFCVPHPQKKGVPTSLVKPTHTHTHKRKLAISHTNPLPRTSFLPRSPIAPLSLAVKVREGMPLLSARLLWLWFFSNGSTNFSGQILAWCSPITKGFGYAYDHVSFAMATIAAKQTMGLFEALLSAPSFEVGR